MFLELMGGGDFAVFPYGAFLEHQSQAVSIISTGDKWSANPNMLSVSL